MGPEQENRLQRHDPGQSHQALTHGAVQARVPVDEMPLCQVLAPGRPWPTTSDTRTGHGPLVLGLVTSARLRGQDESCTLQLAYSMYMPSRQAGQSMIPRTLSPVLRQVAERYPVVSLTGPRQSGKTTLVRSVFPDVPYVSLEDPDNRSFALDDPRGFLRQFGGPVVLDEAQRAPELFSYIQGLVDTDPTSGRFILTGSQNFLLMQSISQTLAGRCALLHLLPLARHELAGRPPLSLEALGQAVPFPAATARAIATDPFEALFCGFYPRIHDRGLPPQEWLASYYHTYLERDVRAVAQVGDLEAFSRFVRLCAGRSGQLLNLSSLGIDAGITHTTARRWLSVLEASFVVHLLRPHHANYHKRLIRSPKLYFLDTGLLCYLLRVTSAEQLRSSALRGPVFETYVVAELMKAALHQGREPNLFFWRDAAGHEVDVIVDLGSSLLPIEVKASETLQAEHLEGLRYYRGLAGASEGPAALVYAGERTSRREGVSVCSWDCL
jgi:predicted AAA+ superfamily ATPase